MELDSSLNSDWAQSWRASIALKITSIVLWGIAVVGLAITVVLLHNEEDKIRSEYEISADRLAYQLSQFIQTTKNLEHPNSYLPRIEKITSQLKFNRAELQFENTPISIGTSNNDDEIITRILKIYNSHSKNIEHINITAYHTNLQSLLRKKQKKLLLTIIALCLGFGMFLTWAMHRVVSRPIEYLIRGTEAVSNGELGFRFNANRSDDFGYLEKFFNKMMDHLQNQQRELEEKANEISHQALHDTLTGLPNRRLFIDRLKQAMVQIKRSNRSLFVMFLDLDRFKIINDTLGHSAGDQLLQIISERLISCVRASDTITVLSRKNNELSKSNPLSEILDNDRNDSDETGYTVARLGGDEFIFMLNDLARPEDAAIVAQRIINEVAKPIQLREGEVFVSGSIGLAKYCADRDDIESLLKNADVAMYQAKEEGRNRFRIYSKTMNAKAQERLSLETNLRHALERNEFCLHYQPQVDLTTGKVFGAEALLRWNHPEKGLLSPLQFIPLLEETGLILPVGEWVLRTACEDNKQLQDNGLDPIRISVNLSARQFHDHQLAANVANILSQCGLDPCWLDLEVTETIIMGDAEFTTHTFNELKAMNINVSLDDFGTGYSSLAYLRRFSIDTLKIDRAFVKDVPDAKDVSNIVNAVIWMAHSLNMSVIAEGVENVDQARFLAKKKCDAIQGFLFSTPLTKKDFRELLQRKTTLAIDTTENSAL